MAIAAFSSTSAAQSTPASSAARPLPPYYELYPDHLPYETGEPIPAGYAVEKNSYRTWAIGTGAIALGVFYTYGLLSVRRLRGETNWLLLPVVGPSGLLFTDEDHCKPSCRGMEQASVIVDAVGQAAAASLLIWGLSAWRVRLVREDLVHPQAMVVPMVVGSAYGVGAVGSF